MRINGSGGSFFEQFYPIPMATAWGLGIAVCEDLGVVTRDRDDANKLLHGTIASEEKSFFLGKAKKKELTFAVQPTAGGCTVIVDIHKPRLEIYSLRSQSKETEHFVSLFEEKVKAILEKRICPHCGGTLPEGAGFCPYCGSKL